MIKFPDSRVCAYLDQFSNHRRPSSYVALCPASIYALVLIGGPSALFSLSLSLYLSFFASLEYSEIRNSSSVATEEMFSTSQVIARAR